MMVCVCSSDASTHSLKKFTVKPILIKNERSNYCIEHTHTHIRYTAAQNKKQHDEGEAHTYTHKRVEPITYYYIIRTTHTHIYTHVRTTYVHTSTTHISTHTHRQVIQCRCEEVYTPPQPQIEIFKPDKTRRRRDSPPPYRNYTI